MKGVYTAEGHGRIGKGFGSVKETVYIVARVCVQNVYFTDLSLHSEKLEIPVV